MSDQKYVFVAVLGSIIIALILLFFIWRSPAVPGGATRPSGAPTLSSRSGVPGLAPSAPSANGEPSPAPLSPFLSPQSFFGQAPVFQPQGPKTPSPEGPLPFQAPPRKLTASQLKVLEAEARKNLRSPVPKSYNVAEVFHLQYPDYYLDYLNTLQDVMLDDKYISPVQKVSFKTHNDVYNFVRTYINFLADRGDLIFRSKNDRNQYIDAVLGNLLLLNVLEADLLEKGVIVPK